MHEFGIAQSILEAVRTEAAKHPGARAVKVGVRIGPMAGVDRESLSFCFQAAAEMDGDAGLALELEEGASDELDLKYIELEEP
ncbi:MAG: hydrogenase maturation nickel metallochaperone HypA [Acidobacteria bacterium]|nr:hydrogenase maturation nickel metallochaperone HypA [Acidobacteriota bacterium]